MSTMYPYGDAVAPYPRTSDEVTADNLARHYACQVHRDQVALASHYYLRSPAGDRQAARDMGMLASRAAANYKVVGLLRALVEVAPEKADEVARQLSEDAEMGEPIAEWTYEWLVGYGIDPKRVAAEVRPVERIDAVVA